MLRIFIALFICIAISPAKAQEQIEKIFDPAEQYWQGKNLGQRGFANTSTAKIGHEWFFIAYNEQTKADIWKTDLEQTSLFIDLDDYEKPFIHGTYGDWLIYSNLEDASECQFSAINAQSKQKIDLITGGTCSIYGSSNFSINDKYFMTVVNNEVFYQDLSLLPTVSVQKSIINENGADFIRNLAQNRIILKGRGNSYGSEVFYILDMDNGSITTLNSLTRKSIHDVSQFTEYNGRYYFQITTEPYVERLLMSCNTNLTPGSITNHGNFGGDLLFIENDQAFFSDFNNRKNTLGIYDICTFSKTDSLETDLNRGYSIWSEATKISHEKYILSSGSQSIFHYDLSKNELTSLMIDTIQQQFAIPWLTIDSGIVIRYRDNVITERFFYFPYSDLKPREFCKKDQPQPYETTIFSVLPGNKLLALVYDEQTSSEYAVIDVLNDNYQILADIHTTSLGNLSQCTFTYLLPDHQIFIGVNTEFGNVGFIYNPITRESNPVLDSNGAFISIQFEDTYGNIGLNNNIYANRKTEYSHHGVLAHDDSTIYFIGNEHGLKDLKLFAYNYKNRKSESVEGVHRWDKIFKVGSEIYIIRSRENDWNLKSREVLHWNNHQLETIYEAAQPDNCYDEEDIHQYFIHNDFLYFTISGRLFSLNSRNNEITLLVDNLIKNSSGCYTDGIVYGNFLVKDNQVYFTESRSAMIYFYIAFLGFTSEIEQGFWKTDGTLSGTTYLTERSGNSEFIGQSKYSTLFMHDNDIYMLSDLVDTERRLYVWKNNNWQILDILVNDTLNAPIPNFSHLEIQSIVSKPGAYQRVTALWEDVSYFQTTSYPPGMDYSPTMLGYVYSFKGGDIPEWRKEREYIYSINTQTKSRDAFPTTQIGDKWYFPFSYREENVQYNYYPEIYQYDLSNKRQRNIINNNSNLHSYDGFIVKDEVLETGYFLLAENHSYNAKVYRLNSCPLIDEPIKITQTDSKVCQSEPIRIQLEGLGSLNWIFIKINGIETPYTWGRVSDSDMFLIYLNLTEGEYSVSYYFDTGCGVDSISTYTLESKGTGSVLTISVEPELADNIYTYSCSDQTLEEYKWIINGGKIIAGQETHTTTIDWGQSTEGTVSLIASNGICISDTVTVTYSKTTDTKMEKLFSFKIVPNPSTGKVLIELPENWQNAEYQLMGIDGRILESKEIRSPQSALDLGRFSSGLYLITLRNQENFITQRLVLMD